MENNSPPNDLAASSLTNGSPEDYAAMFFRMNELKLKRKMADLSLRQLKRIILVAATYPLQDYDHETKTDAEKSVLYILNEMLNQKALMQMSVEMNKAEKALEVKKEGAIDAPVINNEERGNENG